MNSIELVRFYHRACGRVSTWLTVLIYHPSPVFLVIYFLSPFANFFRNMGSIHATYSGFLGLKIRVLTKTGGMLYRFAPLVPCGRLKGIFQLDLHVIQRQPQWLHGEDHLGFVHAWLHVLLLVVPCRKFGFHKFIQWVEQCLTTSVHGVVVLLLDCLNGGSKEGSWLQVPHMYQQVKTNYFGIDACLLG